MPRGVQIFFVSQQHLFLRWAKKISFGFLVVSGFLWFLVSGGFGGFPASGRFWFPVVSGFRFLVVPRGFCCFVVIKLSNGSVRLTLPFESSVPHLFLFSSGSVR